MERSYFFNSSLPRAGSTLFSNIIAQNPKFYCTPTSGFLDLIYGAKGNFQVAPEFKAQDPKEMDKAFLYFCKGGMDGFYNALTNKPYILDKNRGWGITFGLTKMILGKDPKIVCVVRDLRAVFASMEKNFRKNPHKENYVQNPTQLQGTTLRKRIDAWASGIPVGIAIDRLKDMIDQKIDDKILFIRYEDLMENPETEIKRFYEYVELPFYDKHDFVNITQYTQENDAIHGIYGDHQLRPKFEKKEDDFDDILGYEICRDIKNTYKWFYDYFGYV
jgi:sulfotransferase